MREKIVVDKLSPQGELKWRYEGEVIERGEDWLKLEAFFDRDDIPFMNVITETRRPFCGNVLSRPLV